MSMADAFAGADLIVGAGFYGLTEREGVWRR
jgi:hypothetical protein